MRAASRHVARSSSAVRDDVPTHGCGPVEQPLGRSARGERRRRDRGRTQRCRPDQYRPPGAARGSARTDGPGLAQRRRPGRSAGRDRRWLGQAQNGLRVQRVRVPLGVVGVIYENRPNVTTDCGRPCASRRATPPFLRGSSSAVRSNRALVEVLRYPPPWSRRASADAVALVEESGHASAVAFMRLTGPDRLPDPARRARAHRHDDRASHGALRARRCGQLPRVRRPRRPGHGRRHRSQRQDPATRGV